MTDDPWESARASARDDVRAALERREVDTTCAHCGWSGRTAAVHCPQCDRPWPARRNKGLSPQGRRNAVAGAVLAVIALAVGLAIAIPRIDNSKREESAREKAAVARSSRARLAFLGLEQRPHTRTVAPAPPGDRARRAAAVDALEAGILSDAKARARAGTLPGHPRHTECDAFPVNVGNPRVPLRAPVGRYLCYAVTTDVRRANGQDAGLIGQTFWARATFATGKLVWCRIFPRPGERGLQVLSPELAVSRSCDVYS